MNRHGFLKTIIPHGLIELRAISHGQVRGQVFTRDMDKVDAFCRDHREAEVYFGVAPRIKAGYGGKSNCAPLHCLFADIDFKDTPESDAREALARMAPQPSIVVHSGGGLHCYWILAHTVNMDDAGAHLKMTARECLGDMRSAEAAHVLRVPGTLNHKYDPPRRVRIEEAHLERGVHRHLFIGAQEKTAQDRWEPGAEASEASRKAATRWIADYPGAVEGHGGDHHTFAAACRLVRDFALSEDEAMRLLLNWNERCVPPWSDVELRGKVRGAMKYGSGEIGRDDPAGDFEELDGVDDELDDDLAGDAPVPGLMEEMSARFRAVDEDGKLRVFSQRRDDVLSRDVWVRYARRDFMEVCASVLHYPMVEARKNKKGEAVMIPAAAAWLDEYRKKTTYQGIVFAPEHEGDRTPDGRLNLWRGFSVKARQGSWERLKELTWETLCDRDTVAYEYVMNWMARATQRAWEPGQVALVFKGRKGTGKGTLARAFIQLFGRHGMHITSPSLLVGRFNAHLRDVAALFADEAFWAGDKAGEGVLKGLVTEPALQYEGKGANAETGRNCVHIIMASNEEWVVPAGLDGERRFAVMDVAPDTHDKRYWEKLRGEMAAGGLAAMLWELRERDLSSFDVFSVPRTPGLLEQKLRTMEPHEQWLFELLDTGDWDEFPRAETDDEGRAVVLCRDMQESLLTFYRAHNRFRAGLESVNVHLGKMLIRMIPGVRKIYLRNIESGSNTARRAWAYRLPLMSEAREYFVRALGGDPWIR